MQCEDFLELVAYSFDFSVIIISYTSFRIEIKFRCAFRSCGRDASGVDGILEVGKGVVDVVPEAVFGE